MFITITRFQDDLATRKHVLGFIFFTAVVLLWAAPAFAGGKDPTTSKGINSQTCAELAQSLRAIDENYTKIDEFRSKAFHARRAGERQSDSARHGVERLEKEAAAESDKARKSKLKTDLRRARKDLRHAKALYRKADSDISDYTRALDQMSERRKAIRAKRRELGC